MFRISRDSSSASPDQCIGKCPLGSPDNDVYLIPHVRCDMFCQCVYGRPVEMICPPGLHYSEKERVCADPYLANCTRPFENKNIIGGDDKEGNYNDEDCIEKCSWINESFDGRSITFSHRECRKFCKCNYYSSVVHKCPSNFHYSEVLGICTYPKEAKCIGITDDDSPEDSLDDCCECPNVSTSTTSRPTSTTPTSTTTRPTSTTPTSTTTRKTTTLKPSSTTTSNPDASGCIGTCSIWDPEDQVQHLPHKDCTKFCKCDFGVPKVMECPYPLFFNPHLQVCDRPSHAGCTGDKPDLPTSPGSSTKPTWGPSTEPTVSSTSGWTSTSTTAGWPPTSTTAGWTPTSTTAGWTPTSTTAGWTPTSTTAGWTPTSTTAGWTPTSTTAGWTPTSTTAGWTPTSSPGDVSGCIGTCSLWDDDKVKHLPHKDCTKFCKCDFGVPVVFDCPPPLHFNPKLSVCDRPSAAGCKGDRPPPPIPGVTPSTPPPGPTPSPPTPTPGDIAGCIGTCSLWDEGDDVTHLPHKDCTKFCKCDFGNPVVINCPKPLHFNPNLEVCDRPGHAGCTGIGGVPPEDDGNDIARKNILGFNKLFRW
ncbi:hypothetical protein PV325_013120 [Microctonus aethiopoides]|nr:hypothetical protein PV325_013120 [Microctonus aethiopoides]